MVNRQTDGLTPNRQTDATRPDKVRKSSMKLDLLESSTRTFSVIRFCKSTLIDWLRVLRAKINIRVPEEKQNAKFCGVLRVHTTYHLVHFWL